MPNTSRTFLLFASSILLIFIRTSEPVQRKNVVLIVADDAGLEMGAYNNSVISTPNLDLLSSKSVVFTNAFASVSSCSPSRSAILSGRPNHENGMYGLHNGVHHFNSFGRIRSLPYYLSKHHIRTGIIGKKHVGPSSVYRFDYEATEENHSILQVGRNITFIKHLVRDFLRQNTSKPFFLYIAFHDPHRCGHTHPQYGNFCEKFGDGKGNNGVIADWKPKYYDPASVEVPYYIQDTPSAREDISAQYTTLSRLDQGVGLMLKELEAASCLDNSLIIYTSDNGPPFPAGRTNLYDSGISVPLIIYTPPSLLKNQFDDNKKADALVSHLDITPLILEWFQIAPQHQFKFDFPQYFSILSYLRDGKKDNNAIFASHSLHEVTMSYPMRAIRTKQFKLIHNLNYKVPFPIDQDFYLSPSFQDILKRTVSNLSLPWYRSLKSYYYRQAWELFDLYADKMEVKNLAYNVSYQHILSSLKKQLRKWQTVTNDPWICGFGAVLENSGSFKNNPQCLPLFNGI